MSCANTQVEITSAYSLLFSFFYIELRGKVQNASVEKSTCLHINLFSSVDQDRYFWFKHIYFKVTMIIQTDMTYTQTIGLERKHKLI